MSIKLILENWQKFLKENKNASENQDKVKEVLFNTLSAQAAFEDSPTLSEAEEKSSNLEFESSLAESPDMNIVKRFVNSLYSGKRSGFLSYYTEDELKEMNLFLVKGHDAGFAVKTDGDIVSVHNNSPLKGLASVFLNEAKKNGGSKLDHFDGFLSGLYRSHGFTDVYEVYQWDENYKPSTWTFEPVNILDPKTSIYAEAFATIENETYEMKELKHETEEVALTVEDDYKVTAKPSEKFNQYKYGRPDVVFRKL